MNGEAVNTKPPAECAGHRPHGLGYLAWSADAERRDQKGERQVQCPACGLWAWPDHLKPGITEVNATR